MRRTILFVALAALLSGCSLIGSADEDSGRAVVLVTHDSFAARLALLDEFTDRTGITIDVRKVGDAGELTNKLVLTTDSPIGDVVYGVDTAFASRALSKNVLANYRSPEADNGPQRYAVEDDHRLTAVDVGDVCLNIDPAALAAKGAPEPTSYEELTDPRYRDLLVVQDPATSSPGLAFLLGTIAHFGEDGWQTYWKALRDNGMKVASGWEEAYTQDFSGSSGKGPRPLVVSYASSPAAEVADDGTPRTKAVLGTCFRQVEYAGVLSGAPHAEDAKKVLDFLLSAPFQAEVADQMYVYPAREGVELPPAWQQAAPLPEQAGSLPPKQIADHREQWIDEWRRLVQG